MAFYIDGTIEQKKQKLIEYFYSNFHKEQNIIYENHIKSLRDARIEELCKEIEKNSYLLDDDQEDMEYFLCYDLEGTLYYDKNIILTPNEREDIQKNIELMNEYVCWFDEFPLLIDEELLEYEADIKDAWDDLIAKHREG